jgi:transposase
LLPCSAEGDDTHGVVALVDREADCVADYRRIMALLLEERSYREVVETAGCSHRDVARARQAIRDHGVVSMTEVDEAQLQAWFPDGRRRVSEEYEQPDFARVLQALKHQRHFTLLQGWRRYADAAGIGLKKYGYAQYCALFSEYARVNDLVAVLHHEPGRTMFVDWAGDTLEMVDQANGEISPAVLFVAVLPYSGVVFCRAYPDMKSESWLDAHVRAFEFFGGVAQMVVPDNPSTSTHRRHRGEAERVVNARYQQLADHYQTAIVPARARRPRDKAAVESAVNAVNKRVIGYLEAERWFTLTELNEAITARVREINEDLKRADDSTRWERFATEEQSLLGPLPDTRFEDVVWKQLKAGRNYHLTCEAQRYSVPPALAGTLLRVRITAQTVTVFDGTDVIAQHRRLTGRKG